MASPAVAWAAALLLARLSTASPAISFPINSQVPPIARAGQPFSFVFSPSTFSSSSPITYSLSSHPGWLSIDSDARRLFGTPGADAVALEPVVGVPLNLVATDDSGSATLAATLVVSRNPGPLLQIPLERQVPDFGTFSSPSAILSGPGNAFSFQLDPDTFSKPAGSQISYYVTMADNTPLPAWVSFDPGTLTFTGRTPPAESLIQPPQRFSLEVIASDVVGFSGASLAFDIIVGTHQLVSDETTIILNAIPGTSVSYTGLMSHITVDGKPATVQTAVIVSTPDIPPWLSIDKDTWHITGSVPEAAEPTNFTVTVRDTHSGTLNITIAVEMARDGIGLFTGALPSLTITPGRSFSFGLEPYLSDPRGTELSVEMSPSYSWIQFDPGSATLFGHAPEGLKDSVVDTKVKAESRASKKSAALSFVIFIRATSGATGSAPNSDPATTGAHPTESAGGQPYLTGDGLGKGHFNPVLLAVLLPLLVVLALAICALFWYFRRRKDRQGPALSTRDISGPLPGTLVTGDAGKGVPRSLPDFTRRFGKSLSADDIFCPEKNDYFESRHTFLTRTNLPEHAGAVRLLPASGSYRSDPGTAQEGGEAPFMTSGAPGAPRPVTRGKVSSSLSSITETSIGELADSWRLDSVGGNSGRRFRNQTESNVPRIQQTPGPAPSPTDITSAPQAGSPITSPDTDVVPLGAELRLSHYPPALATRKPSWPWLRGAKVKRQGSKSVPGMMRLSEQPSVLTVDTSASGGTRQPSPTTPAADGNESRAIESSFLPLPRFPTRTHLSRPPARSGPPTSRNMEDADQTPLEMSGTTNLTTTNTSLPNSNENATPASAGCGQIPANSLDMYDGLVEHNPFHPSRTWSTVPTTDEWVDETVESLALSRSASQQQNWTVLQESPVIKGRDPSVSGRLPDVVSAVWLPQVREGEAELENLATPSRPGTSTVDGRVNEMPQRSGLTQKSQSTGVSLRSGGSKSDYAVFI